MDQLKVAARIAAHGLFAQSARMRIASENLANAHTTGKVPGSDPYARKTISFTEALDETSGANVVAIDTISRDRSPFRVVNEPGHPAADREGFVKLPNVDPVIELADMREANRSYMANLQMIKQAREAVSMMVDLLRS